MDRKTLGASFSVRLEKPDAPPRGNPECAQDDPTGTRMGAGNWEGKTPRARALCSRPGVAGLQITPPNRRLRAYPKVGSRVGLTRARPVGIVRTGALRRTSGTETATVESFPINARRRVDRVTGPPSAAGPGSARSLGSAGSTCRSIAQWRQTASSAALRQAACLRTRWRPAARVCCRA